MVEKFQCNAAHCMHSHHEIVKASDYDKLRKHLENILEWAEPFNDATDKQHLEAVCFLSDTIPDTDGVENIDGKVKRYKVQGDWIDDYSQTHTKVDMVMANDYDNLQEAFRKYARHYDNCRGDQDGGHCTCGFDGIDAWPDSENEKERV